MTVYRKDDLHAVTMKLAASTTGSPVATLLSAYFHRRYIILYITQGGS